MQEALDFNKPDPFQGGFSNIDDVCNNFDVEKSVLDGAEILLADYEYGNYEGSALVIYRQGGKLWEVHGGHCSCYGLEGQWSPEETTIEYLETQLNDRYGYPYTYFREYLEQIIAHEKERNASSN